MLFVTLIVSKNPLSCCLKGFLMLKISTLDETAKKKSEIDKKDLSGFRNLTGLYEIDACFPVCQQAGAGIYLSRITTSIDITKQRTGDHTFKNLHLRVVWFYTSFFELLDFLQRILLYG